VPNDVHFGVFECAEIAKFVRKTTKELQKRPEINEESKWQAKRRDQRANKKPGIDLTGLFIGCVTCCCSACVLWGGAGRSRSGGDPPHPVVAASSSTGWCGRAPNLQALSWILVACLPLGPWMISKDTR